MDDRPSHCPGVTAPPQPFATPRDHSRPIGHGDITRDIAPADDAIVFNATGAGGRDLYRLRLDDLRVTRIAETPEYEVDPSLSADGKTLVYAAGVPGDRADHVFTRPVDGGPAAQLTRQGANDSTPRFSPDTKLLVYARGRFSPDYRINLADEDGSAERPLTPNLGVCRRPLFNRAGKRVFFLREEWPDGPTGTPKFSLWEVATDGTSIRQLVDSHLFDDPLAWKAKNAPQPSRQPTTPE